MRGTLHLPVEVARDLRTIMDNTAVHANDGMINDQYIAAYRPDVVLTAQTAVTEAR